MERERDYNIFKCQIRELATELITIETHCFPREVAMKYVNKILVDQSHSQTTRIDRIILFPGAIGISNTSSQLLAAKDFCNCNRDTSKFALCGHFAVEYFNILYIFHFIKWSYTDFLTKHVMFSFVDSIGTKGLAQQAHD